MAEPLTKEELALARGYAESVYADTTDPQKHAAAVMMLRLLDTLAALEAENARLRQLAEVGEAVEGMELGDGLFREGEHEWRVRSDLEYETSNWEIVDNAPTPLAAFEAMKQKRAEYEAAVARADDAVLRAAKGEDDE